MLTSFMHTNTPHTILDCVQTRFLCFLLLLLLLTASVSQKGLISRAWCPENHRPVCWGGEEGPIVGVPSTLDHLVPVLPRHCLREGLCQITWSEKSRKTCHTAVTWRGLKHHTVTENCRYMEAHHCQPEWGFKEWTLLISRSCSVPADDLYACPYICVEDIFNLSSKTVCSVVTLKVTDDDFVVIRASEEMMCSWGEAHWADVTAVGPVCLDYAASSDVIQHAGTVLLAWGQQAAAGVHRHRSNCTSCLRCYDTVVTDCNLKLPTIFSFFFSSLKL